MHLDKDKYDVGVVVGRFQVPKLSKAHHDIITRISETHKRLVILIGVAPALGTKDNSMDFVTRMFMLRGEFPNAIISHVPDMECDKSWDNNLDLIIKSLIPIGSICLYGGRDSFVDTYNGSFPSMEISSAYYEEAGTHIREDIRNKPIDSEKFRRGVIYSTQNQYPKVYPTVDLAITRPHNNRYLEVMMGKKDLNRGWSFPGGFVDPTDENYETSALRECSEELDIAIDKKLNYVSSHIVKDWRYKRSEKIMTTLFQANYQFGSGKPLEEFVETGWVRLDYQSLSSVNDSHKPLFEKLIEFMLNKPLTK